MSLTAKKGRLHLWRTAKSLTYNCWLAFFLTRYRFREKTEPSWKNYFIWAAVWGGKQNTPDTQNTLIISLSAVAVMPVIPWTEDNLIVWLIFCRNSFSCKLKKLLIKKITIFCNQSNLFCSSDKSIQIKHFKNHTFIGMSFFFTLFSHGDILLNLYLHGSISKYWISVNKDTSCLKQEAASDGFCKKRCF